MDDADIFMNPGTVFTLQYLLRKGFDHFWEKGKALVVSKGSPLELAVKQVVEEVARPPLEQDFYRWFRKEQDTGFLAGLAGGEQVDAEAALERFSAAFCLHVKSRDEARNLLRRFMDAFVQFLLLSDRGEEIHRLRTEAQHAEQGERLQRMEAAMVQMGSTLTVLASTTTAQSPAAPAANEWSEKAAQIKSLLNGGAVETALSLCDLVLAEADDRHDPMGSEDRARFLNQRGCCHFRMGNPKAALDEFIRAAELNPNERKYAGNRLTMMAIADPHSPGLLDAIDGERARGDSVQLQSARAQVLASVDSPTKAIEWLKQQLGESVPAPDLLFPLAKLAQRAGLHAEAEQFADAALRVAPDDVDILKLKADTLILKHMREVDGILLPPWRLTDEQAADYRAGVDGHTRALQVLQRRPGFPRFQAYEALVQRGIAHMVLGELTAADIDFGKAVEHNPLDTTARFNRLTVNMRLDRPERVVSDAEYVLEHSADRRNVLRNYLSYLSISGKMAQIGQIARRYPNELATCLEAGFIAASAEDRFRKPYRMARKFLRRWRQMHGPSQGWFRAWAHVLMGQGHLKWAERVLLRSMERADEGVEFCNAVQQLASLYVQQQRWSEACAMYRRYMPMDAYSPDTAEYLSAVMHSEGLAVALNEVRSLPAEARTHPSVQFFEAQMEEKAGNLFAAARLFFRLWRASGSVEAGVHCAWCFFRRPRTRRRGEVVLTRIRNVDAAQPALAMFGASMLAEMGRFEDAVSVGYRTVLKHPGDAAIEERYAGLVFVQCHDRLELIPESCERNVVVDVEIGGARRSWLIDPPADESDALPNCEIIRDGSVVSAVLGKKVGDEFVLPGNPGDEGKKGEIAQLRRKPLKLLHEVVDHIAMHPRQNATVRAVPADPKALEKMLQGHGSRGGKAFALFQENRLPISWLAHAGGRPRCEVLWSLLEAATTPVIALPGGAEEQTLDVIPEDDSAALVIDLLAVLMAAKFGLLPLLDRIQDRLVVCQSTVDELTNALQDSKLKGLSGLAQHSLDGSSSYGDVLSLCESFVGRVPHARVAGYSGTRTLPAAVAAALGAEAADMLEVARERGVPVLLGDWQLAALADNARACSLRGVVNHAHKNGWTTMTEVARVLARMSRAGVQFVSVNHQLIEASMELLISEGDALTHGALLAQLSPEKANWESSRHILVACIVKESLLPVDPATRQRLVSTTLSAALATGYTPAQLLEVEQAVQRELELAPLHWKATLRTIRAWRKERPGK